MWSALLKELPGYNSERKLTIIIAMMAVPITELPFTYASKA